MKNYESDEGMKKIQELIKEKGEKFLEFIEDTDEDIMKKKKQELEQHETRKRVEKDNGLFGFLKKTLFPGNQDDGSNVNSDVEKLRKLQKERIKIEKEEKKRETQRERDIRNANQKVQKLLKEEKEKNKELMKEIRTVQLIEKKIENLKKQNARLSADSSTAAQNHKTTQKRFENENKTISDKLRDCEREKTEELIRKNGQISQLNRKCNDLSNDVREKDDEIKLLKESNQKLKEKNVRHTKDQNEKESLISKLQSENQKFDIMCKEKEEMIKSQKIEIDSASIVIENLKSEKEALTTIVSENEKEKEVMKKEVKIMKESNFNGSQSQNNVIEISSKDILLKDTLETTPGGAIHCAVWESTPVIVKIIKLMKKLEEGQKKDVLRDFHLHTRVQNPRIARNFGVSFHGEEIWIVFERMECDLFTHLKKKQYSSKEKIDIMINMCRAIKVIHQYRIVHRDIKCENFLVSATGYIKISDFGEARLMPVAKGQYKTEAAGSIQWMAPEIAAQDSGKAICTFSSDIYSLGCAFYEVVYEKPPFYGVGVFDVMKKKLKMVQPDLSNPPKESGDLIVGNVLKF